MTTLQHIFAIRNVLSHGPVSDDFSYSNQLILHFMEVARAKLIKEKADKYQYVSELSFQSLCMDLALQPFHSCCDGPTDCVLLRTTTKVPTTLNTRWGDFLKITTLDGVVISKSSVTTNALSKYSLVKPNPVSYLIQDGYIFIQNNTSLKKIMVNGIFNSPSQPLEIECSSAQTECESILEKTFPIDADLIASMYALVVQYLMQNTRKDNEQDASDNTVN